MCKGNVRRRLYDNSRPRPAAGRKAGKKMKIKTRLTLSHILMLAVPFLIILIIMNAVPVFLFELFGETFYSPQEDRSVFAAKNYISARIRSLQETGADAQGDRELVEQLERMGYHAAFVSGEDILWQNFEAADLDVLSLHDRGWFLSSGEILLETDSAAMFKQPLPLEDGRDISIVAVNSRYLLGEQRDSFEQVRSAFAFYRNAVLVLSLVVIALTNGVLSSRMAKGILVPLHRLSEAANRIQEGNLDQGVRYDGDDEFQQVFLDFEEMRKRLLESVRMRERYEEDRRELIAGISHDLRTPLTTIKGYAEGLRDGVAATPEKKKRYLDTIYKKASDMDFLVDQLFLFSTLDTGRYPFQFEEGDLADYYRRFFEMAADEFTLKGLSVAFHDEGGGAKLTARFDREQISRVLVNILENTVRYKKKETAKVEARLRFREGRALLTIKDDGPGVPAEAISKLFVSFYRADSARTNPSAGSGLGLSIAYRIVEAHGGGIRAENDGGLAVTIALPAKEEPPAGDNAGTRPA